MKLVIVESPAKAKTINKYLGASYKVEASYGHICDLPSKNGSVLPENDFEMKYEISKKAEPQIKKLCSLAKTADEIILATDPDREGEAISWHVINILREKKSIKKDAKILRVAFNEITKKSVQETISKPRSLDQDLIDAQQARRALDYLVGFNLSPILWRKLPGARSAGRVQSVALRLICEREAEIEKFKSLEYWDISASLKSSKNIDFGGKLVTADGQKLEKFAITNKDDATKIVDSLKLYKRFFVDLVETKEQRRNPPAPFTTSTLQQEASRKLGFSTKKTMQLAQKLYEGVDLESETVGLITYMRTDGVYLADDAVKAAREYIEDSFGQVYIPDTVRKYKPKSKNAQEAHEAIRPTNIKYTPDKLKKYLDQDLHKLYELIWKRTLASQMSSAILETVSADISPDDKKFIIRSSGTVIKFDGFYRLYAESVDDQDAEENSKILPPLFKGEEINPLEFIPNQHFTEPPPRFNEASLVKKLEELGIGRPSTYASIISVIQDREYVRLETKRFYPEERGRLVTAFLCKFFPKYVEYDFTANLEENLDRVADGEIKWKNLLSEFWKGFNENVQLAANIKISDVIENLETMLSDHLFPQKEEGLDQRKCPKCSSGKLGLRISKFGAFIACSNYPECTHKSTIHDNNHNENTGLESMNDNNKLIGTHLDKNILLKKGPYGLYLEIEEEDKLTKPKRATIPPGFNPENITLDQAINLLSLPKRLGNNASGDEVSVGIGKYGPYIKCGNKFTSIPKTDDPFGINLHRALEIIEESAKLPKNKK
ncbi:MAG: type I DNA topoisomerase [Rickettsiaceae bacterium]|nr:type I DNA topoisomerase [Rickettsiaceae bacterium]